MLGTFHFTNTSDYSAIVIDDLDSEKRQSELENLAKFKPTKILAERETSFTDTLVKRLADYKKGNDKLSKH